LQEEGQAVERGLSWLASRQQENGGWGAGHSQQAEKTDVANTCIALQAFCRAGHAPAAGEYRETVRKGLAYVFAEIAASKAEELYVTANRSTQIQRKLGTYVDTFMASSVLPDFKERMGEEALEEKLEQAIVTVLSKMERHQQEDGTWLSTGWAPALAQGLAAKGINKAARSGYTVNEDVRRRVERSQQASVDQTSGKVSRSDAAGIELYASSSTLSSLNDSDVVNQAQKKLLEEELEAADSPEDRRIIAGRLAEIDKNEEVLNRARAQVVDRMDDPGFVAGFGSNGGEEFLSYMNIGESLLTQGGEEWARWDQKISANMLRTQSEDGSWKGKHCITGGTFCTATGLLVLMTGAAPVEVAAATP
jgi:hypothetical protein